PARRLAGGHCKTCDTLADRSGHPQPLSGCKLKATGANQEHLTSHVTSFISSEARPPLADIRTHLLSCAIPKVVKITWLATSPCHDACWGFLPSVRSNGANFDRCATERSNRARPRSSLRFAVSPTQILQHLIPSNLLGAFSNSVPLASSSDLPAVGPGQSLTCLASQRTDLQEHAHTHTHSLSLSPHTRPTLPCRACAVSVLPRAFQQPGPSPRYSNWISQRHCHTAADGCEFVKIFCSTSHSAYRIQSARLSLPDICRLVH
ncbi:hypothetical protein GQ607_002357, partial [Colletotrichum asianum]